MEYTMILNNTFLNEDCEYYYLLKVNNAFNIEKINDSDNYYSKTEEFHKKQ